MTPLGRTLAFLTSAMLGAAPLACAAAGGPLTIRVAATAYDTYAEAFYAQERGEFCTAGLNVKLTTFANGASVAQAPTQDVAKKNAAGLKRFAHVIYETARWANAHRSDSAKIL